MTTKANNYAKTKKKHQNIKKMSYNKLRKGRFSEPGREYFVTTVVNGRQPLFSDYHNARIFIREVARSEMEQEMNWLAWVLMPDHFHGLLSLNGEQTLDRIIQVLKGRSSRALNKHLQRSGPFWQPGFYDHALRREEDRIGLARYIVANPIRAGLVDNVLNYSHWDAVWL